MRSWNRSSRWIAGFCSHFGSSACPFGLLRFSSIAGHGEAKSETGQIARWGHQDEAKPETRRVARWGHEGEALVGSPSCQVSCKSGGIRHQVAQKAWRSPDRVLIGSARLIVAPSHARSNRQDRLCPFGFVLPPSVCQMLSGIQICRNHVRHRQRTTTNKLYMQHTIGRRQRNKQ